MKDDPPSESETLIQKPEDFFGEFVTHSAGETFALAKRFGEQLRGGEVFLLRGELGAGKTVFAKGLAAGLLIESDDVTSPSFTLINVHDGRLRMYHIDLYRLEGDSCQQLGLEEIFEEPRAVVVVEWGDRLKSSPPCAIEVEIAYVSEADRHIRIDVKAKKKP